MRHSIPLRCTLAAALLLLFAAGPLGAQSSQASVFGRITTSGRQPLSSALVVQRNAQTNVQAAAYTNAQGYYLLAGLAAGSCSVRVYVPGYQPAEQNIELAVSGRAEVNFDLKPAGQPAAASPPARAAPAPAARSVNELLSRLYGADANVPQAVAEQAIAPATDTLTGALSSVVDERRIQEFGPLLELGGSDIYNLLLMQPGVTSDNATARGLGSAVNGQRFTSSNFLLDGTDNNDLLVTGPATRISTDAVREFRVTTNNFSAEFGRASGFVAQAITRSGTHLWHGTLLEYFKHDALNANSFGNNWRGIPRPQLREDQYGGSVGGPLRKESLFGFADFERVPLSAQGEPRQTLLPSSVLSGFLRDGTLAKRLLDSFPPPTGTPLPAYPFATVKNDTQQFDETNVLGLARLDWTAPSGRHRLMGRYAFSRRSIGNVLGSAYPSLDAPLRVNAHNPLFTYTAQAAGGTNEVKLGMNRTGVTLLRPHPETPTMVSLDGVALPGSEAVYDYVFRDSTYHLSDSFARLIGRHSLSAGFEWRRTLHYSLLSPVRDGYYIFNHVLDFTMDRPSYLIIAIDPQTGRPADDALFRSSYGQNEWAGFLQDNLKLTPRLSLNLGLRWEYFGVPAARDGTRTLNFVPGAGAAEAKAVPPLDGADRGQGIATGRIAESALFRSDWNNFAPRAGFALSLNESRRSVLRGGYGLFFDRVFNSFWLDTRLNRVVSQLLVNLPGEPARFAFTSPARNGVGQIPAGEIQQPATVMVDQGLRTPYVHSWFLGVQHQLSPGLLLEVNHAGSLGKKLLAADTVNRLWSLAPTAKNSSGRFNPALGDISYRSNQGRSDFVALEVSLNRKWSRGIQWHLAYTWSRTRDVQSDPLLRTSGEARRSRNLTNPSFFQVASSFTRQFDPDSDWGLSSFDQNHCLVATVVGQTPRQAGLLRFTSGWEFAVFASARAGFPFSVYTTQFDIPQGGGMLLPFNRADFVGTSRDAAFLSRPMAVPGGVRLLDAKQFRAPSGTAMGNTSRNAFRGPGFWSSDFAIGRSFSLGHKLDRARLQTRVEFFNLFNHINLDTPTPYLESSSFGEAQFGRQGFRSSVPIVLPLDEQPRRIQLAVKLVF